MYHYLQNRRLSSSCMRGGEDLVSRDGAHKTPPSTTPVRVGLVSAHATAAMGRVQVINVCAMSPAPPPQGFRQFTKPCDGAVHPVWGCCNTTTASTASPGCRCHCLHSDGCAFKVRDTSEGGRYGTPVGDP